MLLRLRGISSDESDERLSVLFVNEERRKNPVDMADGYPPITDWRFEAIVEGDIASVRALRPEGLLGDGEGEGVGRSGFKAIPSVSGVNESGRSWRPAGRGRTLGVGAEAAAIAGEGVASSTCFAAVAVFSSCSSSSSSSSSMRVCNWSFVLAEGAKWFPNESRLPASPLKPVPKEDPDGCDGLLATANPCQKMYLKKDKNREQIKKRKCRGSGSAEEEREGRSRRLRILPRPVTTRESLTQIKHPALNLGRVELRDLYRRGVAVLVCLALEGPERTPPNRVPLTKVDVIVCVRCWQIRECDTHHLGRLTTGRDGRATAVVRAAGCGETRVFSMVLGPGLLLLLLILRLRVLFGYSNGCRRREGKRYRCIAGVGATMREALARGRVVHRRSSTQLERIHLPRSHYGLKHKQARTTHPHLVSQSVSVVVEKGLNRAVHCKRHVWLR
jgi:hypothetical protein